MHHQLPQRSDFERQGEQVASGGGGLAGGWGIASGRLAAGGWGAAKGEVVGSKDDRASAQRGDDRASAQGKAWVRAAAEGRSGWRFLQCLTTYFFPLMCTQILPFLI